MSDEQLSRTPVPDRAEDNAFFPSEYSLTQYTSSKTDFDGTTYPEPYKGGKWKILMIGTQERYLMMKGGEFFSTGNHPVEMLLPLYHLDAAGFEIDIATISGDPVKFEWWAFPHEDEAVKSIYKKYEKQLKTPKKLADVTGEGLTAEAPYLGVFIPGGHGVLNGVPFSRQVGAVLRWAQANGRFTISLCHGPASLLATAVDGGRFAYEGYEMCVFPDSLDAGANIEIGYIPGPMAWLVGEKLREYNVKIVNTGITGQVHRDRNLLTGDSPLASNNLGKLAAEVLLEAASR
ncbi:protease/amidase [Komagataeibacter oboediens DSM 11826]|uniref:Protein deglycase HchA n=1 Tax=Komagataeibacter oboediens TaxID=65958 RepID=A0A318QLS3_9PROT|nr:glyoxalase III HchA [Komagataeibacter oboediens]PYD79360.1 protein deglycase HchA [Komagataeibacter oboediens]GBR27764.1 protease/amidase [Komagataeibacter oboediens DSM 11826]